MGPENAKGGVQTPTAILGTQSKSSKVTVSDLLPANAGMQNKMTLNSLLLSGYGSQTVQDVNLQAKGSDLLMILLSGNKSQMYAQHKVKELKFGFTANSSPILTV